jgi:hypothetical protein
MNLTGEFCQVRDKGRKGVELLRPWQVRELTGNDG